VRGEDVASNSEAHYASATQHAHAARPPSAREIIAFLMLSYAARLRRRLMRNPLGGRNAMPLHLRILAELPTMPGHD